MFEEFWKATIELVSALAQLIIHSNEKESGLLHALKVAGACVSLCGALFYVFYWGKRVVRDEVQKILVDPETFWSKPASSADKSAYLERIGRSIPVIAIANYKGGVGKSMIAANLAAYFDKIGKRVLLIDYDYQGSLTDIVPYRNPDRLTFTAHTILKGERDSPHLTRPQELGQSFRGSYIHAAESALSRIDNEIVFQWLTGAIREDVRFNTNEYISSTYVQQNFDIVIIDTPPRICAATANALCAATRVVMPTILDTVSTRAVFRSVEMFLSFRDKLGLNFKIFGVVPSKVEAATRYNDRESKALAYLMQELHWKYKDRVNLVSGREEPVWVMEHLPIMHKVGLLHIEGDDLAIFDHRPTMNAAVIQDMFAKLGDAILEDVGLLKQPPPDEPHENVRVAQSVVELRGRARASAG